MSWTFAEQLQSERIEVTEGEAHHLLHVLRIKPRQSLVLFDGFGTVADALVESMTRRSVVCRVLQRRAVPRVAEHSLNIAVSPPKGDRLRWMIEKLTELGVGQITLLGCERTVVEPGETRLEKLRGTAVAACKQSRQAWLPELRPLTDFSSLLKQADQLECRLVLAHPPDELAPGSPPLDPAAASARSSSPASVGTADAGQQLLLIGPEGGFTETEVAAAVAVGARLIHWPRTILRIETAAIVFTALLVAHPKN
ncbi:MAG: RsmE family RNA methyltransferase [Planctomycetota bacterium]